MRVLVVADGGARAGGAHMVAVVMPVLRLPVLRWHTQHDRSRVDELACWAWMPVVAVLAVAVGGARAGGAYMVAAVSTPCSLAAHRPRVHCHRGRRPEVRCWFLNLS